MIKINISYCGLDCDQCPAYLATNANSDELRAKTAEDWSKQFNSNIKPEEINCLGCRSEVRFMHCNVCEIRKCAIEKDLENCGKCSDFSCSKVEEVLKYVPEARKNLENS